MAITDATTKNSIRYTTVLQIWKILSLIPKL